MGENTFRPYGRGAVFVLESNSVEAAHSEFSKLPMMRDGLLQADIPPLRSPISHCAFVK